MLSCTTPHLRAGAARESESMDGQEDNGLTLQELAQRLERLERENERVRSENAELLKELTELRGSQTPREGDAPASEEFAGRVSRRSLLSKAGAAALGAVAAGTLLNPHEAKANHVYGPNATISANEVRTHTLVAENT